MTKYFHPALGRSQGDAPDEKQLFKRIASGDMQAFEQFYELSSKRVYGRCVEEAAGVQELADKWFEQVYLELWSKRADLAEVPYPVPYILGLASRLVYRRRLELGLKEGGQGQHPLVLNYLNKTGTDKSLRENEMILKLVDEAMTLLTETQRDIFRLNKFDGIRLEIISENLGISLAAASDQLAQAMAKVRAYIRNPTVQPSGEIGGCM